MTPGRDHRRRELPVPILLMLVVVVAIILALVVWLVLPNGPVTVALIGVVVLGAVGTGVWRILSLDQFSREPEGPTTEPSEGE